MAFYRSDSGSGSKVTAQYTKVAPNTTITMTLVGDANAIYFCSNLNSPTRYYKVYINDTLMSDNMSTIYNYGDAWGSSVGKLNGDFKEGDVVKLTMGAISSSAHVQIIAVMEDN